MESYKDAATVAANLEKSALYGNCMTEEERTKLYIDAAKAWGNAERLARMGLDKDNERWANARADWCLRGRGEWKFGGE